MGQFGDKFRKEREKKGISLDDVSNVTKIGARMLQAIEEEQFDQLPGGVFNKGFIRAYAKHLGLNGEDAVTDYLACLRQAQIDAQAVWEPAVRTTPAINPPRAPYTKPALKKPPPPSAPVEELPELQLPRAEDVRPPRRLYSENRGANIPLAIVAPAILVVVLLAFLWIRHSHNTQSSATEAPPAASAPATEPATQSAPATSLPAPGKSPAKAASAPRVLASTTSQPVAAKPLAAATRPASPPVPGASAAQESAEENDVTVRTFPPEKSSASSSSTPSGTPSSKPAVSTPPLSTSSLNALHSNASAASAGPLTLVIRATENSWVSITADGQPVSHETLIAPAHTSVRASREIVARIGNAAGVSFLLNGKEIPAQGAEAEVKTFIFDETGMRVVPNQPPAPNQ